MLKAKKGETTILGKFFRATRAIRQQNRKGVFIVLDDDPDAQEYVRSVIEREDRVVKCASSMIAAKELIDEAGPDNVASMIIDVTLPDGSGKLFGEWLLATHPQIPFFYFSGQVLDHELALGGRRVQILQKPCSVKALLEALGLGSMKEMAFS